MTNRIPLVSESTLREIGAASTMRAEAQQRADLEEQLTEYTEGSATAALFAMRLLDKFDLQTVIDIMKMGRASHLF